ncbi:MAG TPA: hypothetical protein VG454_13850 [Gemmatimonadales bacterium]|nr:hypothetical protein [Gemmatimonadales bacterium]
MRCLALVVATTLCASSVAFARTQNPLALGLEAGVLRIAKDESILQLGLRAAPSLGGYGSVDFTFATFPDALAHGVLAFLMDLGLTYGAPRESSPVYVFPHAGFSMLSGSDLSSGGGGTIGGLNAGLAVLVHTSPRLGIRADYTYRRFKGADIGTPSITFGLLFMH